MSAVRAVCEVLNVSKLVLMGQAVSVYILFAVSPSCAPFVRYLTFRNIC